MKTVVSYKKLLLVIGIGFLGLFGLNFSYGEEDECTQGDLMQQAFCKAKLKDTIIDLGNTKSAVGNAFIRGSIEVEIGGEKAIDLTKKGSIVVEVTKFILMLTIVLSVTMIILNGIQYIIKSGSGEDPSKIRMNLYYIAFGIILALLSVVIINLLRSVGESTLKNITAYTSNSFLSSSLS